MNKKCLGLMLALLGGSAQASEYEQLNLFALNNGHDLYQICTTADGAQYERLAVGVCLGPHYTTRRLSVTESWSRP